MECNADKTAYKVYTQSGQGDLVLDCAKAGDTLSGFFYNLEITCADPAVICENHTTCPQDCNYR